MTTLQNKAPKKKRKRTIKRSKNPRNYFTQVHEDAIIEFNNTDSFKIRDELYTKLIGPTLSEMVDKIVLTYRFNSLPNIDALKDECKIWLVTILTKFNPTRGSKAFSYFSVVTKNWFIQKVKKNKKKFKREMDFEDLSKELHLKYVSVQNEYNENREKDEFWSHLLSEIDTWDAAKLKENEKKVLEAVKILVSNCEDIEIFNKKAIYLYMREITGLSTKQIVNSLTKMRKRYDIFKVKWDRGEV